jgi:hypothetical protein
MEEAEETLGKETFVLFSRFSRHDDVGGGILIFSGE